MENNNRAPYIAGIHRRVGDYNGRPYDYVVVTILIPLSDGCGYTALTIYNRYKGVYELPKFKTNDFLTMVKADDVASAFEKYENEPIELIYDRYGNIAKINFMSFD